MAIPYHGDTDYSEKVSDLDTGYADSNGVTATNEIVDNIDPGGLSISVDELVGSKTLSDGGVLGDLLELLRVHVNDMINRSELDRTTAGQVYSSLIQTALTGSLDWVFRTNEVKQADKQRSLDMVQKLYEIEAAKLGVATMQEDRKLKMFDLNYIKPLDHEMLVEQVENQHIVHQLTQSQYDGSEINNNTAQYNLDNILPKQATLLDDDHSAKETELGIRSYYKDEMQTVEKSILDDEHCIKSTDCEIKIYYKDEMQPEEKLTLVANREIAQKNVDLKDRELDLADKELAMKDKELLLKDKELDLAEKELDMKQYELDNVLPSQVSLTNAQACVQNAECSIKTYYHDNIQVYEKDMAHAKAFQEEVNAGNYNADDSMPAKKIEQMGIQNQLYTRQKDSYDDIKYQKLFDTQVNYAAMIFADRTEETPEVLQIGGGDAVVDTYNLLTPNQI